MVIGSDGLGEEAKMGVALAFGQVAEDLVVGPILLDDVDDILDRRGIANPSGDGVSGRHLLAPHGRRVATAKRAALVDRPGVRRHLGRVGHGNDRQGSLEEPRDILANRPAFPCRVHGVGPIAIGPRALAFAIGHVDRLAVTGEPHRSGIPAGGNETERRAGPGFLDVDHGEVVGVGIGDQQDRFIGRERQCAGGAARGSARVDCRADCLDGLCGHGIDDAHRIAVGVGHIQHLTAAGKQQFVGMLLSRQRADNLERLGVDHRNRRVVPEADVQTFARLVPGQSVRVGIGRQRDQVADRARGHVEPAQRVAMTLATHRVLPSADRASPPGTLRLFSGSG